MLSVNHKLLVAYDGTNYFGWQKTKSGPSIEETLEKSLEQILQEKITLQAASRTDRGVHATGQVVDFHTTKPITDYSKFLIGANALLPPDIAVLEAEEAQPEFHPTLNVVSKTYEYAICYGRVQLPQHRLYSWHFHYPLDLAKMREAATKLEGTRDFSAFCNQKNNEEYENHIRTVHSIIIEPSEKDRLLIRITGNHFLYKMVRNIVGTLAYVGCGKMTAEDVEKVLGLHDRTLAGVTAPAQGLTLSHVTY
jgi:tRNA pseudouridine38-40 synthase